MFVRYQRLLPLTALLVAGAACSSIQTATQMQHARMDATRSAPKAHLAYMVDNALMHDLSLADIHFIPHSSELSGTGIARLERMAVFLDTYGGTVRLETAAADEEMIQKRSNHVREYLETTGCDMSRVEIEMMMSAGRGMPADDAITIKERLAEQNSGQGTSSGQSFTLAPTSP